MTALGWVLVVLAGVGLIVWGAETFAEHLAVASARLGVSTFALAVLLAGAEPEELVTAVTASLRGVPAIALGDVIGANVAMCLVAVGVGAIVSPVPFGPQVRRYALAGVPAALLAAAFSWNGVVSQPEGLVLVACYSAFVATMWKIERQPPALGEVGEVLEAEEELQAMSAARARVSRELLLVIAGVVAMAVGASALVEGVRRISDVETTQSQLGLVLVGFATALELVVLAWSSARRGISSTVAAAVIGSFTYNVTMTLGAGALVRSLRLEDPYLLRVPWVVMASCLALVVAIGWHKQTIARSSGWVLLALYPVFVTWVLLS